MQRSLSRSYYSLMCMTLDRHQQIISFIYEATFYVCGTEHAQLSCMGKQKSLWCYWTLVSFTEGQCMVHLNKRTISPPPPDFSLENLQWLMPLFWLCGKHYFASCPCGSSFPVKMVDHTLPLCSCISGQEISRIVEILA